MRLILASEFYTSFTKISALLGTDVRGKKAVFIPTAAYGEDFEPDAATTIQPLQSIGLNVESFDLRYKNKAEAFAALHDAAVIFVGGGNTFFLLEHMKKCDFGNIIRDCMTRGCTYIGSSAGSAVCTPDIAYIDGMDDPLRAHLDNTKGLGLIDILYVPHLDHPQQSERARYCINTYQGELPIIALCDSQILYVQNKILRII